ncbi:MAG: transposase [Nitrospira sp.]
MPLPPPRSTSGPCRRGGLNFKGSRIGCRKLDITEQSYYRWKKEYGGLRVDQAKRLTRLEQENTRLERLVADRWTIAFPKR